MDRETIVRKLEKIYLSNGRDINTIGYLDSGEFVNLNRPKSIKYVDFIGGIYYLFSSEWAAYEGVPDHTFRVRGASLIPAKNNYQFLVTEKLIRVESWKEILPSVELSYLKGGRYIDPSFYEEDSEGAVFLSEIDNFYWVGYQSHWKIKDRVRKFRTFIDAYRYFYELRGSLLEGVY